MPALEFGWFLPSSGDMRVFGDPAAAIPPSIEHFDRVTQIAEASGFEYMLIPVQTMCWEAWVTGSIMVGRSSRIKPLIAARPGYINPVLLAKMISTFDQLSQGRICINLIAGGSETEARNEGIKFTKEERYDLMDEEVTLLKKIWTADDKLTFKGRFHETRDLELVPKPYQRPYPKFYLGGGSRQAWEISAKHSDVHLFWGDTPVRIGEQIETIRGLAEKHGRSGDIGFGMRLQVICREREADAWAAADDLIARADDDWKTKIRNMWSSSEANRRMKELASAPDLKIHPHLWTGITTVRPGAGVAVVGNPEQVAATLKEFIDIGCHSFCLSGYPHDEEAERFGRLVMPIIREAKAAAE